MKPSLPSPRCNILLLLAAVWAAVWLVSYPSASAHETGQPSPGTTSPGTTSLPEASAKNLPRWRGFNLLEKFYLKSDGNSRLAKNGPFFEDDFKMIHELGFNFVRLPLDYRVWIEGGDWNRINEQQLKEIDQAVEWGKRYNIHVMINFHRAPGYTVASPAEPTSVWTDLETQRACAKHWAMFAKRYRDVPSRNLSFNLFNEPSGVAVENYVAVVSKMANVIRNEDPDRLIVADGVNWGMESVPAFVDLDVAQSTRGYMPFDLTHYRAEWVNEDAVGSPPSWPRVSANGFLYAPQKKGLSAEARMPMKIRGVFSECDSLRIHLNKVSDRADLVVKMDGEIVWRKAFVCRPERTSEDEWKRSVYKAQWNIYENFYDRSYEVGIPAGTSEIVIALTGGDWLLIDEIALRRMGDNPEQVLRLGSEWGKKPAQAIFRGPNAAPPFIGPNMEDGQWLWDKTIAPWLEMKQRGCGVIVGEFGCYKYTPHADTLRWMEDCLSNWQKAEMGWALWNFRGPFGVLDSQRSDVEYENYKTHKLDRKMLQLLQKY
ncbi:Endoglucanase precursor [Novipirellula aureliae]|uniref:Endoglucanase n=1 Tax=Novipirellula aureliae TaxID=2527966 RepID=A0A5C6DU55_9BACT|nr:cellulase family glycosylhydrolase [Novipirellula aureliae]TWU40258.1 Endoglucanase precursor [Novipirellula aureliae]